MAEGEAPALTEERMRAILAETKPPNGNGHYKQLLAVLIAIGLGICIMSQVGVALGCLWWPPQDWNLVNKATSSLDGMALLLAGGLIGLAKPGGG